MSAHTPIWDEFKADSAHARLDADAETDVVVVGAGITGVTAALLLRREGKRVLLLERNRAASGDTGCTSAHLSTQLDDRYRDLARGLSRPELRTLAHAARRSIELIESLSRSCQLPCGFTRVPGYLFTEDARERDLLKEEAALLAELDFSTEYVPFAPLPFDTAGAVRVDNQAIFQPRAHVLGLLRQALQEGVVLHENTDVASFAEGEPCLVQTAHGPTVRAREVVFAAHAPLSRVALQTKLGHFSSYVVAFPAPAPVTSGIFSDTADPYNYLRTFEHRGQHFWVVGGQDHRTGLEKDTNQPYERLLAWVERRFGVKQVPFRWSGQVMESVDGLPYIGRLPGAEHLWVATGFGGNGLTWGSLAAEIISDLMLGRGSAFSEIFAANRAVPLQDAGTFLRDTAVVVSCYLSDMLKLAEFDGVDAVKPGEGRVVRHDGRLVAAHRDEHGKLRVVTARCPHLGGLVRFNNAENTWDCPCHGSRFELSGNPLTGPALVGLDTVVIEEK